MSCKLALWVVGVKDIHTPLKPGSFPGVVDEAALHCLEGAQLTGCPLGRLPKLLDRLALQRPRPVPVHVLLWAAL